MFYVVARGKKIAIFTTWKECGTAINGYDGALVRTFVSYEQARLFLAEHLDEHRDNLIDSDTWQTSDDDDDQDKSSPISQRIKRLTMKPLPRLHGKSTEGPQCRFIMATTLFVFYLVAVFLANVTI